MAFGEREPFSSHSEPYPDHETDETTGARVRPVDIGPSSHSPQNPCLTCKQDPYSCRCDPKCEYCQDQLALEYEARVIERRVYKK